MTIDEVIRRFDGSLAYSTNSKEICQYIADLLKELKERRKEPEVIYCKDCKAIYCDFCLKTLKSVEKEKDYCSWAERRTDG